MEEELEAAVDLAVAECDGDARAAVRSLILANAYLTAEVDRLMAAISAGFTRGRLRGSGSSSKHNEQSDHEREQEKDSESLPDADVKSFTRRQ